MDVGRAGWVWLDLSPQIADVDPQNVHVIVTISPNLFQQLMMRDDLARVRH